MKMWKVVLVAVAGLWAIGAQAAGTGVMVKNSWIREAPPSAMALGGFMVLQNMTTKEVALVGASSPDFSSVMLHRTIMEGGMSKMVHQRMIKVPAKGEVTFQPGGYHLMLMNPKHAVKAGDRIEITLKFEDGSTLPTTFEVRKGMGSSMPMEQNMNMDGGMHHPM